tara:strand:+ start:63 stop:695 length:633 start_codon:yes stop_codon:yes gene_type:complete
MGKLKKLKYQGGGGRQLNPEEQKRYDAQLAELQKNRTMSFPRQAIRNIQDKATKTTLAYGLDDRHAAVLRGQWHDTLTNIPTEGLHDHHSFTYDPNNPDANEDGFVSKSLYEHYQEMTRKGDTKKEGQIDYMPFYNVHKLPSPLDYMDKPKLAQPTEVGPMPTIDPTRQEERITRRHERKKKRAIRKGKPVQYKSGGFLSEHSVHDLDKE